MNNHKKKYLVFGNAESVHLVKWITELEKYFEVEVLSSTGIHADIKNLIPSNSLHSLNLNIKQSGDNWQLILAYFRIRKIINVSNPDFINAHYITSHGFLIALVKTFSFIKFKYILSAWGTDILVTPFRNKVYFYLTRFILNCSDIITSDAESMSAVIKKFTAKPIKTFPFGINQLPETSFEKKDSFLIFSNRALTDNYNIDQVVQWFKFLHAKDNRYRLVIANQGDLMDMLKQQIHNLHIEKAVTFTGFLTMEEQNKYYESSQYYISIPSSDSTSVSLIEAMSYGCTPIVSDLAANHEWIEDTVNGFFISENFIPTDDIDIKKKMFEYNRKLIKEKAIFPNSIYKFATEIQSF